MFRRYFIVGALVLLPLANAVVIAPPVVYWVTLSISTFIANMLVTLFMYTAAKGFADKKFLGKSMSNLFGLVFWMVGKFGVAFVASLAALIAIAPITLSEIILASLGAVLMALGLSFLAGYREFRISSSKARAFMSLALFAALVGALTFVSAYFALERQAIVTYGEPSGAEDVSPAVYAYEPSDAGALKPSAAEAPEAVTIHIIPQSDEQCIVESAGGVEAFKPRFECVSGEGLSQQRVYCPIEVEVLGDYELKGSCA